MRFWRCFSRRSQEDDELDEELRFHIAEEAKLRMERGQPTEPAWRGARRDFGNFELAREAFQGPLVTFRRRPDAHDGASRR